MPSGAGTQRDKLPKQAHRHIPQLYLHRPPLRLNECRPRLGGVVLGRGVEPVVVGAESAFTKARMGVRSVSMSGMPLRCAPTTPDYVAKPALVLA